MDITNLFLRHSLFSVSSQSWPGRAWKSSWPVTSSQSACSSADTGPPGHEQFAQQGPVAARLVLAIAADREVGPARQRGQEVERLRGLGSLHFGAVAPGEAPPSGRTVDAPPKLQRRMAGRQHREPDVVPVAGGEPGLGDATRGPAHGPEPQDFAGGARGSKPDDPDCHRLRRQFLVEHDGVVRRLAVRVERKARDGSDDGPSQAAIEPLARIAALRVEYEQSVSRSS